MITGMSDLFARHGPKLAVGGLVALNLVLIGALVLRDPVRTAFPADPVPASSTSPATSPAPSPATTSPSPSTSEPTPSSSSSSMTTPTPSESPPKGPSDEDDGQPRLLAANSGRVAWRATSTGCNGSAVVEVTADGGRSWSKTKPGLTAIVRLKAYGESSVFAVGADDQCRPTYAWITGPKQQWQRDRSRVENTWYRTPNDPDEVHAPGGGTSRPCGDGLLDLAGLGTFEAAVRCDDGRIRTEAEGRSWRTVQEESELLSLNADDSSFVSAGTRKGCSGVVVRRFGSGGGGLGNSDCRENLDGSRQETVVAQSDGNVWVWSGNQVNRF